LIVDRQPLASSRIASVGYDFPTRTLEVEFTQGGVYQFGGIDPLHYHGLSTAYSPGSYFDQHIRPLGTHRRLDDA
jgi:hypothetical protein